MIYWFPKLPQRLLGRANTEGLIGFVNPAIICFGNPKICRQNI